MKNEFIVSALLLGDGCIEKLNNPNSKGPYRLAVSCSDKYFEYFEWKMNLFINHLGAKHYTLYEMVPQKVGLYNKRGNAGGSYKITSKYRVNDYYNYLYTNGKKDLTKYLNRVFNPLCLAIWFMDDGYIDNSAKNKNRDGKYHWGSLLFSLSTNNHDRWEVEYAVKFFKSKGLDCTMREHDKSTKHKRNGKENWCIHFRASASEKIWSMIKPYVYQVGPTMLHKFRLAVHLYDMEGTREDIELSTLTPLNLIDAKRRLARVESNKKISLVNEVL